MEHKIARANFQDQFDILQKKKKKYGFKGFLLPQSCNKAFQSF